MNSNNTKYHVSKYVFEFKKENRFAYYNCKTLQVIYGKKLLKKTINFFKTPKALADITTKFKITIKNCLKS